jgi:ATP-binding cassette subfamily F protein 3
MAVATAAGLAKSYSAENIFKGITFEIQERDRIALVGVNGTGKSTLLRIIAGQERPDEGSLAFSSGVRVGYLSQEVTFPAGVTLHDYLLRAFSRLLETERALRAVEAELDGAEGERLERLVERHGTLLHEYEQQGGYTYENRLREVIAGLGLGEERLDQPLETFSGGQRTRAALAERLLSGQDLLLLDEPTNHLDIAATEWLEDYLASTSAAAIVVSHDRYFLDKVATRTWEIAFGRLERYSGNYTRYAEQRAERLERLEKEYAAQQVHIQKTEEFIRRYKAGQRSRQARGRQKQLDRLARVERPRDQAQLKVAIQSTLRSGNLVLALEDLVVAAGLPAPAPVRASPGAPLVRDAERGYDPAAFPPLFRVPRAELRRGERIAVVGPNGAGKTTLLRVITGETAPAAGRVYLGYGVQIGYYAQAHEQLNPNNTVIGEIIGTKPMLEEAARTYLGRFLFSGDDAFKRVSSLSGGERSRLALAKLALGNANFLVLDEPTNHLDIDAREALEDMLADFQGSVLFVSHDRYLIDGLATHIWEVAGGGLHAFKGGWSTFADARRQEQAAHAARDEAAREAARADDPALRVRQEEARRAKELKALRAQAERLEGEVATLEARLHLLAAQIQAAGSEADHRRIADLGREHEQVSAALAGREEEWLALHAAIEEAEAAAVSAAGR